MIATMNLPQQPILAKCGTRVGREGVQKGQVGETTSSRAKKRAVPQTASTLDRLPLPKAGVSWNAQVQRQLRRVQGC